MNLGFLLPAAFAALLALALPLLVHLARRSEQRPTDFAALRWLRERPKPRHRLSIDEILLLVLRLLLLALVVLWLARPVLFGSADRTPWVVVMPGVDAASLPKDDEANVRWLAPGFPAIGETPPAVTPPFASLLRELDSTMPEGVALSVVVPDQLQGADAERPRLSRAVRWRVVPGAMPAPKPSRATGPALTVRYDAGGAAGLRYIRAAALAARSPGFAAAATAQPLPPDAKALIWLSQEPLPAAVTAWIERGGTALLAASTPADAKTRTAYWRDEMGAPLVEGWGQGRGRVLRFTRTLSPAAMPQLLEPDFPRRLHALFAAPAPAPSRVHARDYAPLTGGLAPARPARELQPWLALLVAALLLIERWVATRRSRGVAP